MYKVDPWGSTIYVYIYVYIYILVYIIIYVHIFEDRKYTGDE